MAAVVRVRPVESLAELEEAWRLAAAVLNQDDSHPRNGAFYAHHFPHHPELLLVALSGEPETLCGTLLAHAEPDHVWIGKLVVAAGYRGAGTGSALLALLERNAAAAGYGRLMLGAAREAQDFYARRGYRQEVVQDRPVFVKTL